MSKSENQENPDGEHCVITLQIIFYHFLSSTKLNVSFATFFKTFNNKKKKCSVKKAQISSLIRKCDQFYCGSYKVEGPLEIFQIHSSHRDSCLRCFCLQIFQILMSFQTCKGINIIHCCQIKDCIFLNHI